MFLKVRTSEGDNPPTMKASMVTVFSNTEAEHLAVAIVSETGDVTRIENVVGMEIRKKEGR